MDFLLFVFKQLSQQLWQSGILGYWDYLNKIGQHAKIKNKKPQEIHRGNVIMVKEKKKKEKQDLG